jgi:predicted metal-binding membrane protein
MTIHPRNEKSAEGVANTPPAEFIAACAIAFVASVSATAYFCRSMCCDLEMRGSWKMSMMWMRMPGQTWAASATSFLLMWLAMMVAMMLPSALPMFLNTKRAPVSLSVMATGYFTIWLAVGVGLYALGVAFAAAAMRWETFSRVVPALSGAALIAAGAFHFTRWKMIGLLRCRSPFGCITACPERETNFRLGCKQGAACCLCCTAPMMMMIVLGMMNPLVMVGVAIVIAAEKILPRPELTARLVGIAAIVAGVATTIHKLNQ